MVAQTVGHHNDKVRLEAGATCGLWVGLQDSSCQELTRKLERSEDEVEAGVARGIGGLAKFIPGCGAVADALHDGSDGQRRGEGIRGSVRKVCGAI